MALMAPATEIDVSPLVTKLDGAVRGMRVWRTTNGQVVAVVTDDPTQASLANVDSSLLTELRSIDPEVIVIAYWLDGSPQGAKLEQLTDDGWDPVDPATWRSWGIPKL